MLPRAGTVAVRIPDQAKKPPGRVHGGLRVLLDVGGVGPSRGGGNQGCGEEEAEQGGDDDAGGVHGVRDEARVAVLLLGLGDFGHRELGDVLRHGGREGEQTCQSEQSQEVAGENRAAFGPHGEVGSRGPWGWGFW